MQDGSPVADVVVAFSRSISGRRSNYQWQSTTDADGRILLTLGNSGMYAAKATDVSGAVLDTWNSIPINRGYKNTVTLVVGGKAIVHHPGPALRVMTRNLYLGADINPVLGAPSLQAVPGLVADVWSKVQATDFPARAKVLAREISDFRPHLIGLQEATLFRRQFPGDFLVGNPVLAEEVVFDFLAILLDELAARGANYTAVAMNTGIDVELPSATGEDIRLTDRVVILARADVAVSDVLEKNYTAQLPVSLGGNEGGVPLNIPRGVVAVDALVNGQAIRFVTTHLEQGLFEPVQVGQGAELLQILANETLPVVLVGDFNSAADGALVNSTPTYGNLITGGFVDVWEQAHPHQNGFTSGGIDGALTEPIGSFNRRIDHIFVQGDVQVVNARLVGSQRQTPEGLWPSDHLGMTASLRLD
jgi:endonuclease/exonuclease/phosphatase family metal-dependent hydrolase